MEIKILSPQWGHEHLPVKDFLDTIAEAGYDGIDTWLPDEPQERRAFLNEIEKRNFTFVAHQHSASGRDFKDFQASFKSNLKSCAAANPVLVNSHTGRDYFTTEQNLVLVDIAAEVAAQTNIPIVHETHRGRMGYAPQSAKILFSERPEMEITADFSHWVCVTESMLENFSGTLSEAIQRTRHIHARIGFEQGPQVADPSAPQWAYALNHFLSWWDAIVAENAKKDREIMTITTEFGPFPYMPVSGCKGKAPMSQFEINCFMKNLLRERYSSLKCLLLLIFSMIGFYGTAQIKEPYRSLENGAFKTKPTDFSPDPIINYQWKNPVADDSLQIYPLLPKSHIAWPSKSFTLTGSTISVNGTGDLRFDFGQVNAGWVEFESADLSGDVMVSISEYTEPAVLNAGAQNPVKTLRPIRYGNTYRLELNTQLYEGVRFAWLHVKTFAKPWKLTNFKLICQTKPVNYAGSFNSSDSTLNRIWYTGAYVVKLNILQDYLGAILMERSDRHSWTGDAYPSQAASLVSFGNFDFVRKNIVFTSTQNNGIAAYSMYWVLGLLDYYNYTGDKDFLKTLIGNANDRLEVSFRHFEALPNLAFMGWDERLGAGFENPQIAENQHAYRWLCINAWLKFSQTMAAIGETKLAQKFKGYADLKAAQLTKDTTTISGLGVHAVSEIYNAGVGQSYITDQLARKWYENRNARLTYSPFNQYFILQAMAKAGYYRQALTTLKDQWGGQINYGGTTFFEVFRPSWNEALAPNSAPVNNQCGYTSLAHPWGAGVTRWLSQEVLGIKTISPGFKTFNIIPWLGDSLTWVAGTVPTPLGTIAAAFNIATGICEIDIPAGAVAVKIGIPKGGKNIKSLTVNNRIVKFKEDDKHNVFLENYPAGHYKIKVEYGTKLPVATPRPDLLNYELTDFEIDSTTSGNWKSRYGKDGHFIFGASEATSQLRKPAFIDSIKIQRAAYQTWAPNTQDMRALQSLDAESRTAYAAITQDPKATLQTFTVDLFKEPNMPYYATIYFLDWDQKGRRSAIELFDANSLEILAPVQVIDHYEKGKYIRFKVDRSIRVRINHLRGPNAAVGGIFFN